MIVFNLFCNNDHRFEGWFTSAADFDRQQKASLLSCPVCGSSTVAKALHAPHVSTGAAREPVEQQPPQTEEAKAKAKAKAQYANLAKDLSRLIDYVIANTEDVGEAFPEEARKIHYQEAPERKIRGNASNEQVEELREEGIEVVALPIPAHRLSKSH